MKIAGAYVGLGLGDISPEVVKIKALLKKKFTPARNTLDDGDLYTAELTTEVARVQGIYTSQGKPGAPKYVLGIVNLEFKYDVGLLQRPPGPDTRPILFTVNGAGVPWWVGPDADTARAVEQKYRWQPTGYPGAAFPMGPSITDGKNELCNQIELNRPVIEKYNMQCAMAIYSEGSLVGAEVWEESIKPDGARLNWFKPHLAKTVTWGFPKRQFGKVWPDYGGSPIASPTSGGVDSNRMTDTPEWWRNYAHSGDLYAATEPGKVAEDKNAIWQIIRNVSFFKGPDSLLSQVLELTQNPLPDTIAMFKAMMDAGMFLGKGLTPHTNYGIQPAIDYLRAA